MNRIAYLVLRNIVEVPFWLFRIGQLGREDDSHTMQEKYDYLRVRTTKAISRGNVVLQVSGTEKLPAEQGFILYPNHQGLFDIVAMIIACPYPFRPVAKKELGNIILVKQVMKLLKGVLLDREDIRSSLEIMKNIAEQVKEGQNYLIFAEGTRSHNGNQLLPFKGGSFKSAVKAHCPIVPVALINSFRPFDLSSIHKEIVQLHFMDPIYYEEYAGLKTTELAEIVQHRIQEKINENIEK